MTFSDFFDRALAGAKSAQPFLVIDGREMTYGGLIDTINRLYTLFDAKGLGRGDTIALVTTQADDLAAILLAGLRAGIGVISLNPELTPQERRRALEAAQVSHVFIDKPLLDSGPLPDRMGHTTLTDAQTAQGGLVGRLLKKRKSTTVEEGLKAELKTITPRTEPMPAIDDDEVGLLLFTSGTTAAPKVVELTHANLASQLEAFFQVYDYDPGSHILNVLPLHFTDGLMHGPIVTFLTGARLYRMKTFSIQSMEDLLHTVYRDRITHFIAVPALLSIMDRLHGAFDEAFQTPDFRYIRSSGDRLPDRLWRDVQDRFKVQVVNTYGLSETVCEALYCGPDQESFRIGTIGKPVGCEIRIADDQGNAVNPGETGELLIRGGIIMRGYRGQPELTQSAVSDGWFHTGDYASQDEEGFVTIVGRKKNTIISGGVNVQPQDVTDVLLAHDDVADAVTFGLPDPVWGEVVASAVIPRPDCKPDVKELLAHCRNGLAPQKMPRTLKVLEALPRNAAGKVLIDEVRARFSEGTDSALQQRAGSIDEQVIALAAQTFACEADELTLRNEPRTTLGWDSLAHMNLIALTEETFRIKLSPRDILSVGRLEHLRDLVVQKTGATSSPGMSHV